MQPQVTTAGKVSLLGQARRRVFGLPPEEATFARRGFVADDGEARRRLEHIGRTFLLGYHAALEESAQGALARRLGETASEYRGFAFEGAAMGLALLDCLTPWRQRWQTFTERFARPHIYMMHVGLGWALARLRRRVAPYLARLDPLLGWLAVDGYGFHEGYFKWPRYVEARSRPARLSGYALRVFDQGLGRSTWFVKGARVSAVREAIEAFEPARRADLWSGVGLACTYAGGVGRAEMEYLREAAASHRPQLAQGAAFAAETRRRAENVTAHTEAACQIFCGRSLAASAAVTETALDDLGAEGESPAYEVWRRRIQAEFTGEVSR
jgi:hypothetical protein